MERRADVWFAERTLPRCFQSWVEFTLQGQLREQRRFKAEAFNRWFGCFWPSWMQACLYLLPCDLFLFLYFQEASVRLGVSHLVGTVRKAQGGEALWADGTQLQMEASLVLIQTRLLCSRHVAVCFQAVLHDEQRCVQGAWLRWRGRTQQRIREAEKREASDRLHTQRLLHNTLVQWRGYCSEIRDRWW